MVLSLDYFVVYQHGHYSRLVLRLCMVVDLHFLAIFI